MVAGFGGEVQRIVARAVTSGYLPTAADGAVLLRARGREQRFILQAADELRRNIVGDRVTYVVNRNINFTNACRLKCKFCAFSRTGIDDEAYFLPTEEVVKRAQEAYSYGATEVCLQAGIAPKLNPSFYVDLAKAVKSAVPDIHLHAYSPEEVLYGAANSQSTVRNHIRSLKEAGVGSLPGTSAEILDDAIRRRIGRKLTAQQWREIISTAHEEGLKTTCTVMYGHIESAEHISAHMSLLREIQLDTGGFTEMVPLSFVPHESPMFREGLLPDCRAGPTGAEVLSVHAVARIMLQDRIPNVQASWVKEGLRMAQVLLDAGANDLGGVLMNESISTSAGASHGQLVRPYQLREVISDIGRVPMERTTLYSEPKSLSNERAKRLRGLDNLQDGERESVFGSFSNLVKSSDHRYKPLMKVQSRRRFSNTTFHLDRKSITFSPSYTLVPTYECFNECRYCNFRKAPRTSPWLDVAEARHILELQRKTGVKEILVMSGEVHPRSRRRSTWIERVVALCEQAIATGLHPHTNIGPVSEGEMEQLRDCNVSMGLMLEQLTPALMSRGGVHQFAPSKNPSERLAQLQQAGRLRIPFTTGLLLGIGETEGDRMATLEAIASVAQQFHNIQEVIIQPYRSGDVDQWAQRLKGAEESLAFALCDLPRIVRRAREILPHDVVIQVPPNLVESPDILLECLAAGATDLGGMSPRDEVNPSFGFPPLEKLRNLLDSEGYNLCERLAVHERFISWLPPRLQQLITDGS